MVKRIFLFSFELPRRIRKKSSIIPGRRRCSHRSATREKTKQRADILRIYIKCFSSTFFKKKICVLKKKWKKKNAKLCVCTRASDPNERGRHQEHAGDTSAGESARGEKQDDHQQKADETSVDEETKVSRRSASADGDVLLAR